MAKTSILTLWLDAIITLVYTMEWRANTIEFRKIPNFSRQAGQADRQTNTHDIVLSHKNTAISVFNITLKSIIMS